MSSFTAIKASNSQYKPKSRPVIVVFGGTSGIGAGIVQAFARHTQGAAHIVIIGRNKDAANALIASLPQNTESLYEFMAVDAILIRNVRSLARELLQRLQKINYLVLSQGAILLENSLTDEGLHPMHSLIVYGRVRAALDLAPLLERAAAEGEDARVLSVGKAGSGGPIDLDDLELRKTTVLSIRSHLLTYLDIATFELAKRFPNISFIHVNPGTTISNLHQRGLPFPLSWILDAYTWLKGNSAEVCGEWMMHGLIDQSVTPAQGASFKSEHMEDVEFNKYADETARNLVWEYILKVTDV